MISRGTYIYMYSSRLTLKDLPDLELLPEFETMPRPSADETDHSLPHQSQ